MSTSQSVIQNKIPTYDVTDIIGLRACVINAAVQVEEDGEQSVDIPDIKALSKAAAMVRCLMPLSLVGNELKAIRKILGWSAAELAEKMTDKTTVETISRWENNQNMGGYAEKLFRFIVCEQLKNECPGIDYNGNDISYLKVLSIERMKKARLNVEIPHIKFDYIKVKNNHISSNAWENEPMTIAA